MQSILNSPHHRPISPSHTSHRPVVRLRQPAHLSHSNSVSNSNRSSPSPISPRMGYISDSACDLGDLPAGPEAKKIMRNSLYLTFNAPRVDDYHRGIFLTHPPSVSDPDHQFSGTLFHASYIKQQDSPPTWVLEQRVVRDVSTSQSLVLLFRICTLDPQRGSVDFQCNLIRSVLDQVPLGRQNREAKLGALAEDEGNPVLDGYDCIIWTVDAMNALARSGIFSLSDLGVEDAGEIMAMARNAAGPEDAKSMVGVDFGGLRVKN